LDLSAFKGMTPVEMFGRVSFPPIGDLPYLLTLGPHAFFWFTVESPRTEESKVNLAPVQVPPLTVTGEWDSIFQEESRPALEAALPNYLKGRRWFGGKARSLRSVSITETIPIPYDSTVAYLTPTTVAYNDGDPETYILALAIAAGER